MAPHKYAPDLATGCLPTAVFTNRSSFSRVFLLCFSDRRAFPMPSPAICLVTCARQSPSVSHVFGSSPARCRSSCDMPRGHRGFPPPLWMRQQTFPQIFPASSASKPARCPRSCVTLWASSRRSFVRDSQHTYRHFKLAREHPRNAPQVVCHTGVRCGGYKPCGPPHLWSIPPPPFTLDHTSSTSWHTLWVVLWSWAWTPRSE